jgi:putative membrane protein
MSAQAIRENGVVRGLRVLRWLTAVAVLAMGGAAFAETTAGSTAASNAGKATNAPSTMPTTPAGGRDAPETAAQNAMGAANQAAQNVTDAAKIVTKLHRVNQMEIDAGKMAQDKGSSKAVKDFGAELVRDHQAADKKILAYAGKAGIDAGSTAALSPADQAEERSDQQKMDSLHHLSGADFDRQFASAMEEGHAKVITLVTNAEGAVSDKKLKSLLRGLLPTLKKHERTAQELANGGPHASQP